MGLLRTAHHSAAFLSASTSVPCSVRSMLSQSPLCRHRRPPQSSRAGHPGEHQRADSAPPSAERHSSSQSNKPSLQPLRPFQRQSCSHHGTSAITSIAPPNVQDPTIGKQNGNNSGGPHATAAPRDAASSLATRHDGIRPEATAELYSLREAMPDAKHGAKRRRAHPPRVAPPKPSAECLPHNCARRWLPLAPLQRRRSISS